MPKKVPQTLEGFDPFGVFIGLTFTKCENGHSQCILELNEQLLNPHRALHGGATYTMADIGMGGALDSSLCEDERCATIETNIVYFKTMTSGRITCDTRVVHRTRSIATLESEMKHGDQLIAKAIGTFSIYKDKEN